MGKPIKDIRGEALALSVSERASLAHDLILSLDDPEDLELQPEQEVEISRRVQSVQEGKATGREKGLRPLNGF
jgi:putative addiction module component (TIGR02574 family)